MVVLVVQRAAVVAAFEADDREACLRQLGGNDPADPADPHDRDVHLLVRHGYIPPLFVAPFAGVLEPVADALVATPRFAYFGVSGNGLSAYGYFFLLKM